MNPLDIHPGQAFDPIAQLTQELISIFRTYHLRGLSVTLEDGRVLTLDQPPIALAIIPTREAST